MEKQALIEKIKREAFYLGIEGTKLNYFQEIIANEIELYTVNLENQLIRKIGEQIKIIFAEA